MTHEFYFSAINHIFLMEEDATYGVRERFDGELWTSIFKEIKAEYIPVKLSDDDILRCFQMTQVNILECHVPDFDISVN